MGKRLGTRLGTNLGSGGGGGVLVTDPVPATVPFMRLRADAGITLATGRVQTWTDPITLRAVTNATASQQPLWVASHANLGGQSAIAPDGGDWLQYTGAAADFSFLHNAACTFAAALYLPPALNSSFNTLYATNAATTATGTGANLRASSFNINNGAALNVNNAIFVALTYPSAVWMAMRLQTPLGALSVRVQASTALNGNLNYTGTPAAGGPDVPMMIFNNNESRTLQFGAAVAEMVWWDRRLTDPELSSVVAWFVGRYAVTA
jgi:hypothetical protein